MERTSVGGLRQFESEPLWQVSFPHLADFQADQVDITDEKAKQWLKGELIVTALGKSDAQVAKYVQTGPVIDALYTHGTNDADKVTDLGAVFTDYEGKAGVSFKLWAPTTQTVSLQLFNDNLHAIAGENIAMEKDKNTGVWHVQTGEMARYSFYKYQLSVYHPVSK